jgi:hypothetical protein
MHNDDTADLRAQLRAEIKTDQLPQPLWYLPKMANLARNIDSLANKVHSVPGALLHYAFERLAPDAEALLVETRDNLGRYDEPSTIIHKELEELREALETACNNTAPQTDSLSDMLRFLEDLEKHLHGVCAQIGTHCVDVLSHMEWTLNPGFQHENANRPEETPGPYLLEPVGFSTPAGRVAYEAYAAFDAGSDTYRVFTSGDRTADGRWCEREITYALAGGEGGWVARAETGIPLSAEQRQQILETVRAEVQTAWAQLVEAVTRGPNSSGCGEDLPKINSERNPG